MADTILDLPGETWKPDILSGANHILVSSLGRVKTCPRDVLHGKGNGTRHLSSRIVPQFAVKGTHLAVHIHANGASTSEYVHRLVCAAFHGLPPEDRPFACHRNGNSFDNRGVNIRWATATKNQADRHIHDTAVFGENAPWTSLTDDDVIEIRKRHRAGETQRAIARAFNQNYPNIWAIVHRKSWVHI